MEVTYVRFGDDCRRSEVYVFPECGNCAHAKTRRGLFPFHQCALDGKVKGIRYACENFTPSQAAEWLAWE